MIYKTNYFKKELRQIYEGNKTSTNRRLAFAVFLGFFSFALYFVFQTLQKSVLSDAAPQIMQPSFFSTVYIYIHIAFLLNTAYFIAYYDSLFFSEIRKNSWYLLVQTGYPPAMMIFYKLAALLFSILLIYTVGFVTTVFLTLFLKYTLILAYMPALYFSGLIDLILISILCMTFSLYVKTILNARYITFLSAVCIIALKIMTGYYPLLGNRITMQHFFNLFDFSRSLFLPAAAVIILVCTFVSIFGARNVARYYNLSSEDYPLPPDVTVLSADPATGGFKAAAANGKRSRYGKIADLVITVFLVVFICATIAFNGMVILINASTPGSEVTIRGVIPYVFKSDTMEPDIMLNDLAYFKKVDSQYPVRPGEIILFMSDKVVYVEKVLENKGSELTADIIHYPPMSRTGSMLKTVGRNDVIGIYTGRNRWLGALILFANTIIGRLLFLLVPAILLFYHKQIMSLYQRRK